MWRAILEAPHTPLPADIEAEALAGYEEGERFLRSGQRGAGPEEIAALLAEMKAIATPYADERTRTLLVCRVFRTR